MCYDGYGVMCVVLEEGANRVLIECLEVLSVEVCPGTVLSSC